MSFAPLCDVPVRRRTQISAKIVLDSAIKGWGGPGARLTTMEFTYPLFIHNELMTHRVFSRNAASSRAIPISKMIERALTDTAGPVTWRENCKGMSPHVEMDPEDGGCAAYIWAQAAQDACHWARKLEEMNVHKEITNRLLAPFLWMTTLVTATDWTNFFHLRTAPDAQKEFQVLACAAADAYFNNQPTFLNVGEWHLPYITEQDRDEVRTRFVGEYDTPLRPRFLRLISVGRCARVSYLTHEGKRDISEDIRLAKQLETNGHWSPFEHVAMAEGYGRRSGNFLNWHQFRKDFGHENVGTFSWPRRF